MCNARVTQKHFSQIISDVHQILFLLPTVCPGKPCCFDAKNVFRQSKMAAIKTLTDTSKPFKDIACTLSVISTQISHICAPLDSQTPFPCLMIISST